MIDEKQIYHTQLTTSTNKKLKRKPNSNLHLLIVDLF